MCDYCGGIVGTDYVCTGCGYDYSALVASGEYYFAPEDLKCKDCRRVGGHAEGC